jgi:predicted membrane protein
MGIIALAAIGIISQLITDPGSFIKTLIIMAVVVAVIYFLINRFALNQADPSQKHEQQAFKKAAKKSKKRFQKKENTSSTPKRSSIGSLSAARKKKRDASHLTVIEGKKGKKKNRASF